MEPIPPRYSWRYMLDKVRKRIAFAMPFYTRYKTTIISPRQARDKHREKHSRNESCVFLTCDKMMFTLRNTTDGWREYTNASMTRGQPTPFGFYAKNWYLLRRTLL